METWETLLALKSSTQHDCNLFLRKTTLDGPSPEGAIFVWPCDSIILVGLGSSFLAQSGFQGPVVSNLVLA